MDQAFAVNRFAENSGIGQSAKGIGQDTAKNPMCHALRSPPNHTHPMVVTCAFDIPALIFYGVFPVTTIRSNAEAQVSAFATAVPPSREARSFPSSLNSAA